MNVLSEKSTSSSWASKQASEEIFVPPEQSRENQLAGLG
jgi:hypothetical protein